MNLGLHTLCINGKVEGLKTLIVYFLNILNFTVPESNCFLPLFKYSQSYNRHTKEFLILFMLMIQCSKFKIWIFFFKLAPGRVKNLVGFECKRVVSTLFSVFSSQWDES